MGITHKGFAALSSTSFWLKSAIPYEILPWNCALVGDINGKPLISCVNDSI